VLSVVAMLVESAAGVQWTAPGGWTNEGVVTTIESAGSYSGLGANG